MGCSRSGTTLLQAIFSRHPEVLAIPENNYFQYLIGQKGARNKFANLGIALPECRYAANRAIKLMKMEGVEELRAEHYWALRKHVEKWCGLLDSLAISKGASVWVEKSPIHNNYIEFIEKYFDQPLFIHIIRDGKEVVASIRDRAIKNERFMRAGQHHFMYGVNKWNSSIVISLNHIGKPNHYFVQFESFVKNYADEIRKILKWAGVEYSKDVENSKKLQKAVLRGEKYLSQASSDVSVPESKFNHVFDEDEKKLIEAKLNKVMLEKIISYCNEQ
jgi:hypothetical protein